MTHLPYEIFELILDELYLTDDSDALRACCLICRDMSGAAQARVFRRVVIDIYYDTNEHLTSPIASLYNILMSSPHIRTYIIHFGIRVSSRWPGEALYAPWIAEDEHLALIFPLLVNMRRFTVCPTLNARGMHHKVKWNDFSESAQAAIRKLLMSVKYIDIDSDSGNIGTNYGGAKLDSLDLTGFLIISAERLTGLHGIRELALGRVYIPPNSTNSSNFDAEGSTMTLHPILDPMSMVSWSDLSESQEQGRLSSRHRSQLHTLALDVPVRHAMPAMLKWVQTVFDCSVLRSLRIELPNPAGPGRTAEHTMYSLVETFKGTLTQLWVDLGTIELSRYNQLGYKITEGSSVAPHWGSLTSLKELTIKIDATTKCFLYDHIDWFTNPIPYLTVLVLNLTRMENEVGTDNHGTRKDNTGRADSNLLAQPSTTSASLESITIHIKFTNFQPRLYTANLLAWGDLFSPLANPVLFPKLMRVVVRLIMPKAVGGTDTEAGRAVGGQVREAAKCFESFDAHGDDSRRWSVRFECFVVDEEDVWTRGGERLPRI